MPQASSAPLELIVLHGALTALGCGAATPDPAADEIATVPMSGDPVALTEIRVSPAPQIPLTWSSGFTSPQRIVVRTQQEWATTWATIWSRQTPVPALPVVDFTSEVVVVAASGYQSNGGVRIAIPNAALDQGGREGERRRDVRWCELRGPGGQLQPGVRGPHGSIRRADLPHGCADDDGLRVAERLVPSYPPAPPAAAHPVARCKTWSPICAHQAEDSARCRPCLAARHRDGVYGIRVRFLQLDVL